MLYRQTLLTTSKILCLLESLLKTTDWKGKQYPYLYLTNILYRLLEASLANPNIKSMHVGIISDSGLNILATGLVGNDTLRKLEFSENPQKTWTKDPKAAFLAMLKDNKGLEVVRFTSDDE